MEAVEVVGPRAAQEADPCNEFEQVACLAGCRAHQLERFHKCWARIGVLDIHEAAIGAGTIARPQVVKLSETSAATLDFEIGAK